MKRVAYWRKIAMYDIEDAPYIRDAENTGNNTMWNNFNFDEGAEENV